MMNMSQQVDRQLFYKLCAAIHNAQAVCRLELVRAVSPELAKRRRLR